MLAVVARLEHTLQESYQSVRLGEGFQYSS